MKLAIDRDKLTAAITMVRRTGARQVQIRYSDDEQPTVWFAVAIYDDEAEQWDAGAARDPLRALLRLLKTLVDGGQCKHCKRPTGFEPDSIETMPLNQAVCWYQWDPELKTFRRGCE